MTAALTSTQVGAPVDRKASRRAGLLDGAILPTLLGLALPTIAVQLAQTGVGVAETFYVSYLGTNALAGVSLVFPVLMIMIMMSAGGLGGGVALGVARAIGAGRHDDADALVTHALVLALGVGALFMVMLWAFGPGVYRALGGAGGALRAASQYSFWVFAGAIPLWVVNLLSAALRGAGNFRVPSTVTLSGAGTLVALSPALIFGLGPIPSLGIAGAGVAVTLFYLVAALVLVRYLAMGANGSLRLKRVKLQKRLFGEILGVGLLASVNSVASNVATLVVTAAVGVFGTQALAGYGAASRLDYVLVPILFGLGTAVVTMVGVSIGAGDFARARRVASTGAFLGFTFAEGVGILTAVQPDLWLRFFTQDEQVTLIGRTYLSTVAPVYGALGVGMLLSFAAQGGGRMLWTFVAFLVRMLIAAGLGWIAVHQFGVGLDTGSTACS